MGKIGCKCGNTVVDQADNLNYKGRIIPDSSYEDIFDSLYDLIDSYVEAVQAGKKQDWMEVNGLRPPYPQDSRASSLINYIFFDHYQEKTKEIFQCEECGRILIQNGKSKTYLSFKPETDDWKDILKKFH